MERQWVTAEEIRGAILNEIHRLEGDCSECAAPNPIPRNGLDESGCNWTVHFIPSCPSECLAAIEGAVEKARARFNLRS